jgi:hypothetical protein
LVGFDVLQQQINPIRRFNSNAQTPDSGITPLLILWWFIDQLLLWDPNKISLGMTGVVFFLRFLSRYRLQSPSMQNPTEIDGVAM